MVTGKGLRRVPFIDQGTWSQIPAPEQRELLKDYKRKQKKKKVRGIRKSWLRMTDEQKQQVVDHFQSLEDAKQKHLAEPEEGDTLFHSEPAASANEFDRSDLYDYFRMGQMIADFESDLYVPSRDASLVQGGGMTPERNLAPTSKVAKMPTAPIGEIESHHQRHVDFNLGIPAMIRGCAFR